MSKTVTSDSISAQLHFLPSEFSGGPLVREDLREPDMATPVGVPAEVAVMNARSTHGLSLQTNGFELLHAPSCVADFFDHTEVMKVYYDECKVLARKLTGAHTAFTFDHIIRESGLQYSSGGTDGSQYKTGLQSGGGYIGGVHMDYTDRTTWDKYLAIHGQTVPSNTQHVYALNFWRVLSPTADDDPLAVCDARTVRKEDLLEVDVYGYGAHNYSWHDIGIETYSVSFHDQQRWYYYPGMTPSDVLVIKSFDSDGVVGATCPHASFNHPNPQGVSRRSVELRVLCFC